MNKGKKENETYITQPKRNTWESNVLHSPTMLKPLHISLSYLYISRLLTVKEREFSSLISPRQRRGINHSPLTSYFQMKASYQYVL
jgi:hypothetical protein